MPILTRDQILAAQDRKPVTVPAPGWGGEVLVRGLSGKQLDSFQFDTMSNRSTDLDANLRNLRARLVADSVVDEQGNLLFAAEDIEKLGEKDAKTLDGIFEVAASLSGIGQKSIESLVGSLPNGQSVSTGSATPRRSTAQSAKLRSA